MGKFFDMDSPVMRVLNRVGDLMIMNFLMILCCIPVITAGAAFTAMHYVLLKIVRGEEGYLIKGFFKSFKENFKQATILWLLMLLVGCSLCGRFVDLQLFRVDLPESGCNCGSGGGNSAYDGSGLCFPATGQI